MAFLLLLHQKMKLQRKENALTLKQLRFSSKVDRMQKKVDKRQKYYDKLKKQIERQANYYKNSMNMAISNQFGMGTGSLGFGNNGSAAMLMQGLTKDVIKNLTGQDISLSDDQFNLAKNGGVFMGSNGKYTDGRGNEIDADVANNINRVSSMMQQIASSQVTQMQSQASNMKAAYENNVSIWMEAQLEQLEAQEEWEMDLLSEEQADMEAEKNSVEVQLQRVQEEKKNIEQALGQAIQDSAPKFGLA